MRVWSGMSSPVRTTSADATIATPNAWRRRSLRRPPMARVTRRPQRAIAESGTIAPRTYATAIATIAGDGPLTAAVAMTAAMIGPTQGAQIEADAGADREARREPGRPGLVRRRQEARAASGNPPLHPRSQPRDRERQPDDADDGNGEETESVGREPGGRQGGRDDDRDENSNTEPNQ